MHNYLTISIFFIVWLIQGCAAPATKIASLKVTGGISPPPKERLEVKVVLSEREQMRDLETSLAEIKNYGQNRQTEILQVQPSGQFESSPSFSTRYGGVFFILPPLGTLPFDPPKPYFYLQFSDYPDEIYLVGEKQEAFHYQVFSQEQLSPIAKNQATKRIIAGRFLELQTEKFPGWCVKLEISEQDTSADH